MQLALLTATVKLFLKRPSAGGELVPKVLKWATEEVENPDLRDPRLHVLAPALDGSRGWRGRLCWRASHPISTETDRMDRQLLDQLLLHGASLASIFHRQPQTFIRTPRRAMCPTRRRSTSRRGAMRRRICIPNPSRARRLNTTAPSQAAAANAKTLRHRIRSDSLRRTRRQKQRQRRMGP